MCSRRLTEGAGKTAATSAAFGNGHAGQGIRRFGYFATFRNGTPEIQPPSPVAKRDFSETSPATLKPLQYMDVAALRIFRGAGGNGGRALALGATSAVFKIHRT